MLEFLPSAGRARALDGDVRAGFAASLASLLDALARQEAVAPDVAAGIVAAMEEPTAPPGLVAAYAALVEAIYADRPEAVLECVAALAEIARRPAVPGIGYVTLDDGLLGGGQSARYRALFDDDPASPLGIARVDPDALGHAAELAGSALALLDRGAPELAGEIRTLLRQIVFVRSDDAGGDRFQGASVFLVWGAVLLNLDEQPDRLTMAESLAHETGHGLLSGFTRGAPLVENDPVERHASPLRTDPRPMDGIVHATYVTARMHYCLARLLASDALTAAERGVAETRLVAHRRGFRQGLEVIDRGARFTDIGWAAFEPARAYMAGAAG